MTATSSPTWSQLAGWLATAHVETGYGTATGPEVGGTVAFAIDGDRLELRWDDGRRFADDGSRAVMVEADGTVSLHRDSEAAAIRRFLRALVLDRDDFHRAAGPPRATTVAGRAGWAVDLLAPHKSGRWQIVVDDETGCLLSSAHDELGPNLRITSLELGADPAADFGCAGPEPVDPMAGGNHESALFAAGRAPTVHTHPRGHFPNVVHADGDRVVVLLDVEHPDVTLSVAPVGAEPLDPGIFAPHHQQRTVGDHVWLVASYDPLPAADVDRMLADTRWLSPPEPASITTSAG